MLYRLFIRIAAPLAFSDLFVAVYTSGLELRKKLMTDARTKFELRRLKVPELKHFLKRKRIPYTEKRTEEFVLLDEKQNPEKE